ncbi:MAG: nucleoside 2-deoxyribosyltransferase domain-containing protein [Pirellulales bacterium]
MRYIEAPDEYDGGGPAVFLAGGISDTGDWQATLVEQLRDTNLIVLNPRRRVFPTNDFDAGGQQIEWEWRYLERADLVAFWFPPQTLCPIALFELGASCSSHKPLVVGSDPDYTRRFDLEVQLRLRRPEVELHASINAVAQTVVRLAAVGGQEQ